MTITRVDVVGGPNAPIDEAYWNEDHPFTAVRGRRSFLLLEKSPEARRPAGRHGWRARRDSNPRLPPPEGGALSAELRARSAGVWHRPLVDLAEMLVGNVIRLGTLDYEVCWDVQCAIAQRVAEGQLEDTLVLVEHPPVLTLGARFREENLLLSREQYRERGISVVRTDRGGDVTFHGPNQQVAYPIFDLRRHGRDLHKWMRDLEETVIRLLSPLGISGERNPPHTGVWVGGEKVAAIGVKVSRWVSIHGIALNCDNDLSPFDLIVPCGIRGAAVTSLTKLTGRRVSTSEASELWIASFESVFGLTLRETRLEGLGIDSLSA